MEEECAAIKKNALSMSWYMRGGVTYEDVLNMSTQEREEIKKWLDDNKPAYELNVKKYNIDNKKLQDMLKSQTKAGGASGTVAYNDSSRGDTFNNQNVATVNNFSIVATNDNSMRFLNGGRTA